MTILCYIVSVLLKTSRGLKLKSSAAMLKSTSCFSALEDEPWIEASLTLSGNPVEFCFSALEDEPWIEAALFELVDGRLNRFQCS